MQPWKNIIRLLNGGGYRDEIYRDKLTHLREVLKLTQKTGKKLTGVKVQGILGIETGAEPMPETVKRIAEGLSVDEHYFYLQESRSRSQMFFQRCRRS